MIDTVIFDYGGVLTIGNAWEDITYKYLQDKNLDIEEENRKIREIWQKAKVGGVDSLEFWKKISNITDLSIEKIRQENFENFAIIPEMIELVEKIKSKGYKTGLLSNLIDDWAEYVESILDIDKLFDVAVFSSRVKDKKPNESIFQLALDKLNSKTESTLFIDDKEKNTKVAKKLGFETILHKNYAETKLKIENLL